MEAVLAGLTRKRDAQLLGDERGVTELSLCGLLQIPVDAVFQQGLDLTFKPLHESVADPTILDPLVLDGQSLLQLRRNVELERHFDGWIDEVKGQGVSPARGREVGEVSKSYMNFM